MNKRKIRDSLRLLCSIALFWLYIPHLMAYFLSASGGGGLGGGKRLINSDLDAIRGQSGLNGLPYWLLLLDMLHNNRYYRVLFYHRIGPVAALLISWYRPGDKYFRIRAEMPIGAGMWMAHPYSTILNAESIGDNFKCLHCTTLGAGKNGIPSIGDNVTLGCNVTIIGKVRVGNNVTVGAGSVVVKDIPDNSVVVGNPAKVIKTLLQV